MKYEHISMTFNASELTEALVKMKDLGWNLLRVSLHGGNGLYCTFNRPLPDPYIEQLDKWIDIYTPGADNLSIKGLIQGMKMAKELYLKLQK